MTSPKKYRGKKEFYLVLTKCIEAAKKQKTLTYKDIAELMPGVPEDGGHYMANETGAMAGAISKEMDENGNPMLSALIVHSGDGKPGEGFYKLAKDLDKFEDGDDKEKFWQNELNQVYDYWMK